MTTVTLCHEDIVNFVTGNGQTTVEEVGGEGVVGREITRYAEALAAELGRGFEVEVSNHVLETNIDGFPAHYSEYAEAVANAEARVAENFW